MKTTIETWKAIWRVDKKGEQIAYIGGRRISRQGCNPDGELIMPGGCLSQRAGTICPSKPLKAISDISELNTYAYCGHSVIMDQKKRPWQDMGYVLSFFGKSLRESRKRYVEYIESGIEQGRRPELVGGCGTEILIGRFGKTFWHDRSRGRVCCAKGWANRQSKPL